MFSMGIFVMLKKRTEKQELCPYDKQPCEKYARQIRLKQTKVMVSLPVGELAASKPVVKCDYRFDCSRYRERPGRRVVLYGVSSTHEIASGYRCPFNQDIDCSLFYRCDEFFRQQSKCGELKGVEMECGAAICQVRSDLCPKYIEFINKQKVR